MTADVPVRLRGDANVEGSGRDGENKGEDVDSAGVLECPRAGRDAMGATIPLSPLTTLTPEMPRPFVELEDEDAEIPAPLSPFGEEDAGAASKGISTPPCTTSESPNSSFHAFSPPTSNIGIFLRIFVKERS